MSPFLFPFLAAALQPGTYDRGYNDRRYRLVVPSNNPTALVVCLHGITMSKEWACNNMAAPYVNDYKFVAVCPEGQRHPQTAYQTGWNTNYVGAAALWTEDDVGFLRDLIAEVLQQAGTIASERVYALGFSMGGGMSFRLACEYVSSG